MTAALLSCPARSLNILVTPHVTSTSHLAKNHVDTLELILRCCLVVILGDWEGFQRAVTKLCQCLGTGKELNINLCVHLLMSSILDWCKSLHGACILGRWRMGSDRHHRGHSLLRWWLWRTAQTHSWPDPGKRNKNMISITGIFKRNGYKELTNTLYCMSKHKAH
jgi:hypothetical protein